MGNLFLKKVRKSQIRKFLGSFRYRKSAHFLGKPLCKSKICNFLLISPQIAIRKFLQNTAQLCLKTVIQILIRASDAIFVRRKSMFLRNCGSFISGNKIKRLGPKNRKSATCHIFGRSANLPNYSSQQICELPICGTYFRTAHPWSVYKTVHHHARLSSQSKNVFFTSETGQPGLL